MKTKQQYMQTLINNVACYEKIIAKRAKNKILREDLPNWLSK